MQGTRPSKNAFHLALIIISFIMILPSFAGMANSSRCNAGNGQESDRSDQPYYTRWVNSSLIVPWNQQLLNPSISANADGSVNMVWADGREGTGHIYYTKLDQRGRTLIPEKRITDEPIDLNLSYPTVHANPSGGFQVVWLGDSTDSSTVGTFGRRIYCRSFNSDGNPLTATASNWFNYPTTEYPTPEPDMWEYQTYDAVSLPDSSIAIVFTMNWSGIGNNSPPSECPAIGWMRLAENGTKLAEKALYLISNQTTWLTFPQSPRLAAAPDNTTHVIWFYWFSSSWVLRWCVIDGMGTVTKIEDYVGGERFDGDLDIACSQSGLTHIIFMTWDNYGTIKDLSFPADSTPRNGTLTTVFTANYGVGGGMAPDGIMEAHCDSHGNLVIIAEGTPVGGEPDSTSSCCIGIFVQAWYGDLEYARYRLVQEYCNSSDPYGPPLYDLRLSPSLAVSGLDQVQIAYLIPGIPDYESSSTPGIYLERTMLFDPGLRHLSTGFDGPYAYENDTLNLSVEVFNDGDAAVQDAEVNFSADGIQFHADSISVGINETAVVGTTWAGPAGNHTFSVLLNPAKNPDGDLTNNQLSLETTVFVPPDLSIVPEDIALVPNDTQEGNPVQISAAVRNYGGLSASADVDFRIDGNLTKTSESLVGAGGSAVVGFTWTAVPGNHTLTIEIYNCSPPERNFANNNASLEIRIPVQPPPVTPRIWIDKWWPEGNVTIFENGNITFGAIADTEPDQQSAILFSWTLDGRTVASDRTGNYTYRSNYTSSGIYTVEVTAHIDSGPSPLAISHEWNLTVVNVNRPPEILGLVPEEPTVTFPQYNPKQFQVNAYDPDGDILTYRWELDGKPIFGSNTTSMIPRNVRPGLHVLTVNVSDGQSGVSGSWNIHVTSLPAPTLLSNPLICLSGVVIMAVAFAAILLLRSRRRPRAIDLIKTSAMFGIDQ